MDTKLQKQWYNRLAKLGFEDIEILKDDGEFQDYFKTSGNTYGRFSSSMVVKQDVLAYYLLCSHWKYNVESLKSLACRKLPLTTILKIWHLHCEGLKYSEIYRQINKKRKSNVGRKRIINLIADLEKRCFRWHELEGDLTVESPLLY